MGNYENSWQHVFSLVISLSFIFLVASLVDPCKETVTAIFLALADVPSRRPIKGLMSMQRSGPIEFRYVVN